jgi:hypothetical protein
MFKHDENTIDPRDTQLVSYLPYTKRFVVESSSLKAAGITPEVQHYTIDGTKFVVHLWSEKFQTYICYRFKKQRWFRGELISEVFTPYFDILSGGNVTKAYTASLGTELHILND